MKKKAEISTESDALVVKRKGGGNIIENRPVFSRDAKTIFLTTRFIVQAYNVVTGDKVQDYEPLTSKVVGVEIHPSNPEILIACSEEGQLVEYYWKTGRHVKEVNFELEEKVFDFHLIPVNGPEGNTSYNVMLWLMQEEDSYLSTVIYNCQGVLIKDDLRIFADVHKHSFAFSRYPGKEFSTSVNGNRVYVFRHSDQQFKRRNIVTRVFTCVSCHPSEEVIATGDNTGRVVIWYSFFEVRPHQAVYHWHTLPVRDVAFSDAGTFFYSGGEEGVLVKWKLDNHLNKSFLPRLPATICHLVLSPDNIFIAVSTEDNGIQLIDPHKIIVSVIQHLTWGVVEETGKRLFPAGIVVDPRTNSIVLNSRCGHIQFYCPHTNKLLYNLDITCHNKIAQQRHNVIVNTDVVRTAVSSDGLWLATVEERDDGESSLESRLKFWQYDLTRRIFTLNTSIERPHNGSVTSVRFQPMTDLGPFMLVTAGKDCKFRSWSLVSADSIYKEGQLWRCESVGFYKDLAVGDMGFSSDGSLLGVTFASILTVWVPETSELKCSLTHVTIDGPLNRVEFGRRNLNHMVVVASSTCVAAWNLLSLALLWVADVSVAVLVSEPIVGHIAIFTTDSKLIVFLPDSHEPVYEQNNISPNKCNIEAAVFLPHINDSPSYVASWLAHSQLYFIDSEQEMLTIDSKNSSNDDGLMILPSPENIPLTPFAAMMAHKNTTNVELLTPTPHLQTGVPGAAYVKQFLKAPAHTMPSLTLLCGSFIRSFVASSTSQKEETKESERMEVDIDEESDSEETPKMKSRQVSPHVVKHEETDLDLQRQLDSLLKQSMGWTKTLVEKPT